MSGTNGITGPRAPHLPLAAMYERTNKRGEKYIVGRIGHLKLMILCADEVSKGDRVWQAFITEGVHHPAASVLALAGNGSLEDAGTPQPR
jgi:hypothetical protein